MSLCVRVIAALAPALIASLALASDSLPNLAAGQRLAYSSYFTGTGLDNVQAMVQDKDGGIWVAGSSSSPRDFAAPNDPFQSKIIGGTDVFLAKYRIDNSGAAKLQFWTYIGGTGNEEVHAMALDSVGRVYLTGTTTSTDFPFVGGYFSNSNAGGKDIFLAVIDTRYTGRDSLTFATTYGGDADDFATGIAITKDTKVIIAGYTLSGALPNVEGSLQGANRGGYDCFLVEFDPYAAKSFMYATYLGGTATDIATGVAVDADGNIWMAGYTASTEFPIAGDSYRADMASSIDAFIVKIDFRKKGLDQLIYGTYFGGDGLDVPENLQIDSTGAVWISGYTTSHDLPLTANAVQRTNKGFSDLFVARFDFRQSYTKSLVYSTYLGGVDGDIAYAMQAGTDGRVAIAGYTMSPDYPVTANAYQPRPKSEFAEAFVAVINTTKAGTAGLEYSTYFGGKYTEIVNAVLIDDTGNVLLGGSTTSWDIPVTDGSTRQNSGQNNAGFLVKIGN